MGLLQSLMNLFGGESQIEIKEKQIKIDTYSPIENLISKREMKTLETLYVSGPARAKKDVELLKMIQNFSKRHEVLKNIDLSGIVGMTEIPEGALSNCSSLKKIVLPKGLHTIKNEAFKNCSNLETVIIPEGVERIHEAAFANCPKLYNITLPKSLYRLGKEVFSGDDSITKISIPSKVESIGTGAFNCKNLSSLIVEPHNPSYISVNNVLYSRNGSALVKYASGQSDSDFCIPENVAKIVEEAFFGCTNLRHIEFNSGLNIIGDNAFAGCKNLDNVTISNSISVIGNEAFADCSSLSNLKIDYGVTRLGNKCFSNCTNLEDVTLPNSLIKIGDEAFSSCAKLKSCNIPSSVEYKGKNLFQNTLLN